VFSIIYFLSLTPPPPPPQVLTNPHWLGLISLGELSSFDQHIAFFSLLFNEDVFHSHDPLNLFSIFFLSLLKY
jgi:hypothetical protein